MRGQVFVALLGGILIGLAVNYAYFAFVRPPSSWHVSAAFVVANSNTTGLYIGYSYPNVYNISTPEFTVNADFWRITWKTLPYYQNVTGRPQQPLNLYYAIPGNIVVSTSNGFTRVATIDLLDPSQYNINPSGWVAEYDRGLSLCYRAVQEINDVIGYSTLMTGKGNYYISAYYTTGCFNFTIEEYY